MTDSLSKKLARLTPEQRALLAQRMQRKREAQVQSIPRRAGDSPAPASFAQERLWFLEQLEPGSPAYQLTTALRLDGPFDPEALQQALELLARRHEVLRTHFRAEDGRPIQVVHAEPRFDWVRETLDEGIPEERDLRTQRILDEEIRRPYDLEAGPLMRARLVSFGERRHLLLIGAHHIVTDGWSQGILVRELSVLYAARLKADDSRSELPELQIQYSDFADWQRQWLSGEVLERQLSYWRGQLTGVSGLELPTDRPRPLRQSGVGDAYRLRLPKGLVRPLAAGGPSSTTPFMTLLAGFAGLLSRLTSQLDFAIGSPVANRRRTELEGLIGLFVNTLAMRLDLRGDPGFLKLLTRARDVALGAFDHQDLPFEKLVEELSPERQMDRSPLFQVLFALQNMERQPAHFAGTETRPVTKNVATTRLDLELYAWELESGWELLFVYNTDLFDKTTIRRMARHYRTLLQASLDEPQAPLSSLSWISRAERQQALIEDSDSARRPPIEGVIHRRIARQAAATPDAVALVGEDGQVTYRGLLQRASHLAARLRDSGAGRGTLIGLCTERGPDMVASLLAVLESGAAYVPLDPGLPADRLAYMADDAGLTALVTERQLARDTPAVAALAEAVSRVVWLGDGTTATSDEPDSNPVSPNDLAYVIYTSGSTGRPKGVQLSHGNAVNFLRAMAQAPGFETDDVMLAVTTLSFDIAVLELLLPLCVGARTVIATHEVTADGERLAQLQADVRASVMQATPATWQLLVQIGWPGDPGLKILCGGEALPPRLSNDLASRGRELWNLYGPTETTVWSAAARLQSGSSIYLGRAIDNTGLYVLDRRLRTVPRGIAGQLAIAGRGLARGYLHRPALTAGSFCPDPFVGRGERLYLTGDLVRRDSAGRLFYLGRLDHQVKLRGFRIELGEIEAALETIPAVERAVVLLMGAGEEQRLIAFLLASRVSGREMPAEPKLRSHLAAELPEYMVPAAFVTLDEYPLTASGKVDRKALSRRDVAADSGSSDETSVPRGPVEETIANAFAEVLNRGSVGRRDSFFALGGHSLLATRLLSRLRAALDVSLPLRSLFEAPTVAELAARFEEGRRAGSTPELPAITAEVRSGPLPLSHAQERLWFLERLSPGDPTLNLPFAVRLRGPLQPEVLATSLNEIVHRHEALRTRFLEVDGRPVQEILPSDLLALPTTDLSALSESLRNTEIARCQSLAASEPFDLAEGKLIRARLLKLAVDDHALLINLHHIAGDAWSLGLLWTELATLYRARLRGLSSPLPELPVQYGDYAVWQRRWLDGGALDQQTDYWRRRLEGPPEALELPTDRPRPAIQSYRGRSIRRRLSPELSAQLHELGSRQGSTLFMVMLAAFKVLLSRWSGQNDVVVGAPIAGRTRSEVEDLIGLFLNSLVLRADLAGEPTFLEVLQRVREATLGAYDHQEVPFEKLLMWLEPERDPSRTPLFQVFFNMLELPPIAERGFEELDVEVLPLAGLKSKFDLTLYVSRQTAGIVLRLVYSADLFDPERMEELMAQYRGLLGQVVVRPEHPVDRLSLITSRARQTLPPFQGAGLKPRRIARFRGAVHEIFAQLAAEEPDRPAVIDSDGALSYGELSALVDSLAADLAGFGVDRGDTVAIYGYRSAALVWAVLGTLRAGGAFLILDPQQPVARQREMLSHAKPAAWLEIAGHPPSEDMAVAVSERFGDRRLILPERDRWVDYPRRAAPAVEITADDLAYIAFTSGSTGGPKGIRGRHGSLSHFVPWQRKAFGFGPADRFSLLSGLAHDPLQRDIFTPLQVGAAVVIPDPERMFEPGFLATWMAREEITVAHLTPALGQVLAETGESTVELPELRWAFLVGEVLTRRLVARLEGLAPRLSCVNYYGSTETQRAVSYHPIAAGSSQRQRTSEVLPLGRGIPGVDLLVLGSSGELAGVGETGELFFRSPHISLGYLQDPALTAERFIPDAWGVGGRLYRSGDLGRYRPDGEVVFSRRADHQVKLRGFRIEPAEIEATLESLPAVEQAVVLLHDGGGEDRQLVAFLLGRDLPEAAELRAALAQRLPDYMVPSTLVGVDDLPLTANGKIDRKSLAQRARQAVKAQERSGEYQAPRGPIEEAVAAVFAEVLKRRRIGVYDSFFALGGHSLLATRLVFQLRQRLGTELALKTVFEEPTVSGLAARIESARHEQLRRVELPSIEVAPRDADLPLSFGQQRLWFLEQLEPDSPAYRLSRAAWILGSLDVSALAESLRRIVERHEALRTTFAGVDGEPVQRVTDSVDFELEVTSERVEPEHREHRGRQRVQDFIGRPFDLTTGPLMRALLVEFAEDQHLFVLCLHHIVTDGWSQGVLVSELASLYEALSKGSKAEPALPSLPVQYPDFSVWQRRWLSDETLEPQRAYWREQLDDVPALELPVDHLRPAVPSYRGGTERLRLPGRWVRPLVAGGASGTTPFMALLAGFAGLLSRLTGQRDFAVGSPIANRRRSELEGLIGLFINTLALRVDSDDDPSYRRLLGRVREVALGAYSHQDVPFEKLVDELAPERDMGRSPLFQVLFALQNMERRPLTLAGTEVLPVTGVATTTRFDLELYAWELADDWELLFVYNADLFDASTIGRFARQFVRLLGSAQSALDIPMSCLELLGAAQRHQALIEDSDSSRPLPDECLIHRRVALRAAATPDAVAVIGESSRLTYSALLARAGELAGALRAVGVGPGTLVGLCTERGPDMVASLLAVLETGAAYVPLDPGLPADRLAYMAEDAGLVALISERPLAAREPAVAGLVEAVGEVVWLDVPHLPASSASTATSTPADLAYVIYTSGSTGRPKGVQLSHGTVVNFLQSMAREPGLTHDDVVLAVTTLSFDIAVLEILLPLVVGAKTVIATRAVAADGERLARLQTRARASVMQATPATWQLLVQIGWQGDPNLNILCGGEALPPRLAAELLSRCRELWNLYGPTETTVWSAASRVRPTPGLADAGETTGAVSLGRAVDNTGLYVFDRRLRPVPRGIPGQLAIAGAGLARGYLRRPALTAGVFGPDSLAGPGARLYLTGDLVRRDGAGRLIYLGRIDHQIKLRGFRIELGEIEAALETLPTVERAVVLLHEARRDDRRLIAFLLSPRGTAPPESEIRDHLASELPDYMIPAGYATVTEYPLNPSGKVDRKALIRQAPELLAAETRPLARPPAGPTEEAVAAAFRDVLGRDEVGAHDSFFALGGHSLLAARLIYRLRDALGPVELRAIFETPTVAGLAERLETTRDATGEASQELAPPPIEKATREGDLPLSFGQERLWFLEQLEPDSAAYRLTRALWIDGPLNVEALGQALDEIVRRHESLRTTFVADAGVARQVVMEEAARVLELGEDDAVEQISQESRAREWIRQEVTRPFELGTGPLLRARLVSFGEDRHLLVLCLHHIVTDAWSQGVLGRELASLYGLYRQDPDARSPLGDLQIQYPDFALWQRQWLAGRVLDQQLAYWRRALTGVPSLELPTDRRRPEVPSYAGGRERLTLPSGVVDGLTALGGDGGTTPFMALLTGLAGLVFRLSGQQDFAVGSPVANRRRPELEGLIGLFINLVALRLDLSGGVSFRRLLNRVREASLAAFNHQDLPFEKLVDELAPERHMGRSPIFQILFAVQNVEREALSLAGTRTRPAPKAIATTRYDLELYAWQTPDRDDWQLSFVYNADLFDATSVRQIARGFTHLLTQALVEPDAPLSDLALLNPAEHHQARVEEGASRVLRALASDQAALRKAPTTVEQPVEPAAFEAPRGHTEEIVATAFCEILRRDQVGRDESFFRLGGHSLLATQLLSRLRSSLDVELPLRALFESPTVAELAAASEAARRIDDGQELPPMVATARAARQPLSHAQERLWFLDRMNPGDPTLNLPSAVRLRGPLEPQALEAGLNEIVRRHESLRTRFLEVDGQAVQEVLASAPVALPLIDLQALPESRRLQEVQRWQGRELSEPFDLSQCPMIRARLLRLAGDDHALVLNLHHIAGDAWSLGLLWTELAALYRAAINDQPSPLPELAVQYGDYAAWQRRWLDGEELSRQSDYWRRQLAGPPAALELPMDHPRPVNQSYRGGSVRRRLSPELSARLGELGWQHDATLFMVLLAAFKVLLSRWSGQHDVVVGTPIAGRIRSEIESLIGLFLNSLVLRTDLAGRPTFSDLLKRVREATLGAYSHQDVPFEKLLAELQPERDPSRTPLFQVFFNMLELPSVQDRQFEGLEAEPLPVVELRSKFDLTIYVSRRPEGIGFYLVYNTDLFDAERMDELMAQYEALLSQATADPERCIEDFSLETGRARRVLPDPAKQLDASWQGAVHEVFARLAQAEPTRLAVIDPRGMLTYGELVELTDAVAAELAKRGVGRGDLLAIYGYRSAALVVAVLGSLRAGGAFLILDPAHPDGRQLEILERAQPAVLIELADHPPPESLREAAQELLDDRLYILPERDDWPQLVREAATPPRVEVSAADLAYVALTSGSTGGPKGICGAHGSLSHFVPWQRQAFGFGAEDRFSMVSGLAHDPLQRDMFTPLQVGGAVVIPDPEEMFRPGALASWMAESEITVAHLTPALGQVLAETAGRSIELPALRWAFLVGDVLTRRQVAQLEEMAPELSCVNYYGSTETQRAVGYHPVEAGESRRERAPEVLPLGRGIPDVQLLVLGRGGQRAGIGEAGEILVRSPHVSRGYLGDPVLTASRFTPDTGGGRVYRTGDIGRYRPDGEAVFLRRADHQIKVRGYRIEPAEIEAVLNRHPGVREVAVGLVPDPSGEQILVAWWTERGTEEVTLAELRDLASEHLPVAMLPAVYVRLENLPLTPTGKLDRAELRRQAQPALTAQREEHAWVAPADAIQVQLVSLWEQILRRNPIGIKDNFFDLGGHSLLAIRLFALIEQTFGRALPISTLFQAPTVEQLARVLRREGFSSRWSSVVPIHPWGDRPPLFCVHGVTGDPFIYRHLAQHLGSDQPLYGLLARGLDGKAEPFTRMEDMAAYYLEDIRQVQPEGPYFLGGFCFGGVAASEIARQLMADGEEVALLATFDGHAAISPTLPSEVVKRYRRSQLRRQARRHLELAQALPPLKRISYLGTRASRLATRVLRRRLRGRPNNLPKQVTEVSDANRYASRSYAPDFYPGRVHVFRSVESLGAVFLDPRLGWQVLARDGIEIHDIPGLHHGMFDEPNVEILAAKLRRCLDEASGDRSD